MVCAQVDYKHGKNSKPMKAKAVHTEDTIRLMVHAWTSSNVTSTRPY